MIIINEFQYLNTIFRKEDFKPPVITEDNIVMALRANRYIRETVLNDHISSFNFTREAFMKGKWDSQTTKARGLFLYTDTGKVAGRGYEKFFYVDEEECTKTYNLRKNLKYPLVGYLKYNGYLGLLFYDHVLNQLNFCTKSVGSGEFVDNFETIVRNRYTDSFSLIETWLKENDFTLVFEVIDPINDPHIIEYEDQRVILLDAVKNDLDFFKIPYPDLIKLSDKLGLSCKIRYAEFKNWEQFLDYFTNDEYIENDIEGLVFEDQTGFMFKNKTRFYKTWKWFRGIKDRLAKGQNVDTKMFTEERHTKIYAFLKSLDRETLETKSIIELRKLYNRYG